MRNLRLKPRLLFMILLLITFSFVSCTNGDGIVRNNENDYWPIEGTVSFDIRDSHGGYNVIDEPDPAIFLETTKRYNSGGHDLIANLTVSGQRIMVSIEGVDPPAPGEVVTRDHPPAYSRHYFDLEPGTYDLEFYCMGSPSSVFKLLVHESYYELTDVRSGNVITAMQKNHRIPQNAMSIIGTYHPDNSEIVDNFVDQVIELDGVNELIENSDIAWPSYSTPNYSELIHRQIIIQYHDEANFALIESLFANYFSEQLSSEYYRVEINDWKNRWLYSDLYNGN